MSKREGPSDALPPAKRAKVEEDFEEDDDEENGDEEKVFFEHARRTLESISDAGKNRLLTLALSKYDNLYEQRDELLLDAVQTHPEFIDDIETVAGKEAGGDEGTIEISSGDEDDDASEEEVSEEEESDGEVAAEEPSDDDDGEEPEEDADEDDDDEEDDE
eukprot:Colp12_sorted_trinity150504_noHs@27838